MQLNALIDHTDVRPDATHVDIERLCDEVRQYGFASVCVNSCWTSLAAALLAGWPSIGVTTVVGFPLGACSTFAKAAEAARAVDDGATEIDMVINVGHLRDGDDAYVAEDIAAVVEAAGSTPVTAILECGLLTDDEIARACRCAVAAGAAFVKTGTGFSDDGATVRDVELMRETVGERCKVAASGGIRTREAAEALVAAGADRLGTSSGVAVVTD